MSKILYAAGTMAHINSFHLPYVEALRAEGHEVLVMASGDGADFDIAFEKKMLSFRNIKCRSAIKKILKREKFDVLILNTTLAAFNIRFVLPRKNRPRVINIVHGYMFGKNAVGLKDKIFLFCEKILRNKTDAIIVMNSEDKEITKKHKLCIGDVRFVWGMGATVYPESLPPEQVYKHMHSEGKYVITFVGELYKAKNQRMLICALPEIKMTIPNAVLWLIGEGVAHAELSALAESLSVSDSVFFTGRRGNPCDFIRASHLYVSASLKEGLPFNIIEALGCGKTVIATDVKGHRDIIEDGVSGFLFAPHDISGFVDKVKRVYSGELSVSPEKLSERYSLYSKENVFDKTYSTIKELMEK